MGPVGARVRGRAWVQSKLGMTPKGLWGPSSFARVIRMVYYLHLGLRKGGAHVGGGQGPGQYDEGGGLHFGVS